MLIPAIAVFGLALSLSLLYGSVVRRWALHVHLVDAPDSNRKLQKEPVALGGGLVVYLSLVTVIVILLAVPNSWDLSIRDDWKELLGFFIASTIVVLVGLFDDCYGLRGRHKLLGQMVAAVCLMCTGLVFERVNMFGIDYDIRLLKYPFTVFWFLGAMNAINLLDGIDGLATMLGAILTATIAVLAMMNSYVNVAMVSIVITGALLGFLRYNLPPARMYLGDAGSMLIGLMVGAMAIRSTMKGPGTVLLAAPVAIWAIPILDSGAAILRRKLTGRSIYMTDRGHLHHRLLEYLGSNTKVLMVVGVCCLVTSLGAMASVWMRNDAIAIVVCVSVVSMLAVTGAFGRSELSLLLHRLHSVWKSLAHPTDLGGVARESQVRLQGDQKWEVIWETLTESADKLHLVRVHLDVNAPALHESYIATWTQPEYRRDGRYWRLDLPLSVGDMQVGHLDVRGHLNDGAGLDEITSLLDLLEPFQARLAAFARRDDESGTPIPIFTKSVAVRSGKQFEEPEISIRH